VRQLGLVDNITSFHAFFKACARSVGQVLNITALANDSNVSDHTARRWIALLEDHHQIFLVQPYPEDFGKRLIKSPKLYFYDPGVVCCLLGISETELSSHEMKLPLFETLIMSELYQWTPHLYFWKDQTRQLDCIIKEGDISIPLGIQNAHSFIKDRYYWHKISQSDHAGYSIVPDKAFLNDEIVSWHYLQPLYKAIRSAR
jgi:predicted AAA+ superfamily ATPase